MEEKANLMNPPVGFRNASDSAMQTQSTGQPSAVYVYSEGEDLNAGGAVLAAGGEEAMISGSGYAYGAGPTENSAEVGMRQYNERRVSHDSSTHSGGYEGYDEGVLRPLAARRDEEADLGMSSSLMSSGWVM